LNKKITIAIDGYSSTGKSTLAKQIAKELGYVYVDTGAMYRAIAYYAMKNNCISTSFFDKQTLIAKLPEINLKFKFNPSLGFAEMYLNDVNIENEIRSIEVSNFVSIVAEVSEIRSKLVQLQQEMGKNKGIVMDGRDIGTVVFPDAELKIFMTASPIIRAQRRFTELKEKGTTVSYEDVLKNVQERDYIDTHRQDSPLIKAENAIEIDNSNLTREQQFQQVMELVAAKLN
jgi:cytidylate kinase